MNAINTITADTSGRPATSGGRALRKMFERPDDGCRVLSAAHIAHMLSCSEAHFRSKRPQLEKHGFPKKLPGCNAWSRVAVEWWIDSNAGRDTGEPRLEITSSIDPVSTTAQMLDDRYAGGQR
jgi:hypothetical protein